MSSNLKRQRPEASEPDSQELPSKKSELDGDGPQLLRPAAPLPPSRPSSGLFRRSFLPSVDLSQSEALQKLKAQQEEEKAKTPLVLLDPKSQFQPKDAEKFTVDANTAAANGSAKPGETAATFGKFEKEEKEEVKEEAPKKEESKKTEEVEKEENGNSESSEKSSLKEKEIVDEPKEKVEPTARKLNPFQKVASETAKSGGFGSLSITKSSTESKGLNPFQRLAASGGGGGFGFNSFKPKEETTEIKEEEKKDESSIVSNSSEKVANQKEPVANEKIVTGEEEEKNVLQVPCKLFQFDKKESTYSQRGRGTLRVNDCGEGSDFKSRLVFRTSGTQKVAMNSKIWANMSVEQVGPKSIRISAQDTTNPEGGVGIFLVQTALHDSKELFKAIDSRIIKMKTAESSNLK